MTTETATLGAGCFWGVEYVFLKVPGVLDVVSGFSGGTVADPSYREVCGGRTRHAEVVQITFDPAVVTYDQLLEVFFRMHDPTQVDRQGPDIGDQYRSAIFTHDRAQRAAAEAARSRTQARLASAPVATSIEDFTAFYPAGDEHQRYYARTGHQPYCHVMPPGLLSELGLTSAPAGDPGATS
jgi:methionine-S-sulfoxide reductase